MKKHDKKIGAHSFAAAAKKNAPSFAAAAEKILKKFVFRAMDTTRARGCEEDVTIECMHSMKRTRLCGAGIEPRAVYAWLLSFLGI
jgi:hypothetical protein